MMEVTIHVPADIAARWQSQGDLPRDVLEGAALEAYRKRIIGESWLQQWLGFGWCPSIACINNHEVTLIAHGSSCA
jgi:hypothetical protein